jgi:ABC-2 type transport system permease protein
MLNLFRGEVYRLFHKRNMYIYLGAVLFGYVAIIFMRSGGFGPESVVTDAGNMMQLMPALLGGYFFASLYTDDLQAKSLTTLVGYGTSRTRIVLTKLALMAVFSIAAYVVLTALHLAMYAILGHAATGPAIGFVIATALQSLLLTLGYALVASVVAYGTQKPTSAVVAYFMLAFSVVGMLVNAASTLLHLNLGGHLLAGTTSNIMLGLVTPGQSILAPTLEFLAYLALAIAASIFVFKKKELEF